MISSILALGQPVFLLLSTFIHPIRQRSSNMLHSKSRKKAWMYLCCHHIKNISQLTRIHNFRSTLLVSLSRFFQIGYYQDYLNLESNLNYSLQRIIVKVIMVYNFFVMQKRCSLTIIRLFKILN